MEYHYFKNSWHLLHNGPYLNVKYDTPNRQRFLHNGAIFEYVNKIWWKRLLNNGLPWVPYHYGIQKHCQICWIGGLKRMFLVRWHAVWTGGCVVCLDEEFWCCLVVVFIPTDSWLLTWIVKQQIAPLSIISPSFKLFLSVHICLLCSLSVSLLLVSVGLSLSRSNTHTHAQIHTTGEV